VIPTLPPCPDPFADVTDDNGGPPDGDVDSYDFGPFQLCVTGVGGGVPAGCECFDHDNDDDIDNIDFNAFAACTSGSTVPADPACDD
jgi:hypothetical protein